MDLHSFYLSFLFFVAQKEIWKPENRQNWKYLTKKIKFTLLRSEVQILLYKIPEVFEHLIQEDDFHPFLDCTDLLNQFTSILLIYQFSKLRKSLNLLPLEGNKTFFLVNFNSYFLRYIFNDSRVSFNDLSFKERRNIKIFKEASEGNFDSFFNSFRNFPDRSKYAIIIGIINFSAERELYQIIDEATDTEIFYVKEFFHYENEFLNFVQKVRENKFSSILNLIHFGFYEAACQELESNKSKNDNFDRSSLYSTRSLSPYSSPSPTFYSPQSPTVSEIQFPAQSVSPTRSFYPLNNSENFAEFQDF